LVQRKVLNIERWKTMEDAGNCADATSADETFDSSYLPYIVLIMQVSSCELYCHPTYIQIEVNGYALDGMGSQFPVSLAYNASDHDEAVGYVEAFPPGTFHRVSGQFCIVDGDLRFYGPEISPVPRVEEERVRARFDADVKCIEQASASKKNIRNAFLDSALKFAEFEVGKSFSHHILDRIKRQFEDTFTGRICFGAAKAEGKCRAERAMVDALALIRPFVDDFVSVRSLRDTALSYQKSLQYQ
jgi:hypothetical protein